MNRYCLVLELKDEFIEPYCDIYRNPWPELLKSIKDGGAQELLIRNYKNFSIVYYECEDIDELYEGLNKLEVTKKWNMTVVPWFKKSLSVTKDGKFITCEKIFDLNQQIAGKLEEF
jgi:L-rhamnose mutarotase